MYTDGGTDETGSRNVYASSYNKDTLMVPEDSGSPPSTCPPLRTTTSGTSSRSSLSGISRRRAAPSRKTARTRFRLITELNSGGDLEPSFEYRFEDGSTVTFLMELNEEPENELDLVRFSMPASEHERLVNAFLQEQFGGYDPADSGQQCTRQVLEAMVVSRSEDGMCMLEPQ